MNNDILDTLKKPAEPQRINLVEADKTITNFCLNTGALSMGCGIIFLILNLPVSLLA